MKPLSKSEYLLSLKHPAWLWFKRNEPNRLPGETAQDRFQLEQGLLFEALAEQLFPGLERLGFDSTAGYRNLPAKTKALIDAGAVAISQGRIEIDGLTCIVDILERNDDGTFNLYEIKGSTSVKTEHEHDLAYQVFVLEKAGYQIQNIGIVHADKTYRRSGEIDIHALTTISDVSDPVRKRVAGIEPSIGLALSVAERSERPDISPLLAGMGAFSEWLDIYKSLQPEPLPENHVYQLAGLGIQRAKKLKVAGVELIEDIPTTIKLTAKQQLQTRAILSDHPLINTDAIRGFRQTLTYPLYFLDYETFSHVIPPIDGVWPYQQVPFQYSLHRLDEDGTLTHNEYLHRDSSDPVPALTDSLRSQLGDTGSVLVWYEPFEKGRNKEMGEVLPEASAFYTNLNERIVDLMHPFSKGMYVDAAFGGSASIKKVLPVLVPELSYKELEIQNGSVAQQAWMKNVFDSDEPDPQVFDDLVKYCTLDTYAMVEILRTLSKFH